MQRLIASSPTIRPPQQRWISSSREWLCGVFPDVSFSGKSYTFTFPTRWEQRHINKRRRMLASHGRDVSQATDDDIRLTVPLRG